MYGMGHPFRGFKSMELDFIIFVKLSCETNFFLYSLKSNIDENGSLNYHTTHKNYQNLLRNGDYGLHNRLTTQI